MRFLCSQTTRLLEYYAYVLILLLYLYIHTHTHMHTHTHSEDKDDVYGNRHQEAVKIFNALLAQDVTGDPIKLVQDILEKCFDIQDLQSEVSDRSCSDRCGGGGALT